MNEVGNELFVKSGKYKYKYYFDTDHFYKKWEGGCDEGELSYPLHKLSNKYSRTTGRSEGISVQVKTSMAAIVGSIVIYFSDYNDKIPLLAPVLLLFSVFRLYPIWSDIAPSTWTVIRYEDGEEATYIEHDDNEKDRINFENSLAEAIKNANRKTT